MTNDTFLIAENHLTTKKNILEMQNESDNNQCGGEIQMNGTENENTSDSKSSAIEEMFENEKTVKYTKEIKCTE